MKIQKKHISHPNRYSVNINYHLQLRDILARSRNKERGDKGALDTGEKSDAVAGIAARTREWRQLARQLASVCRKVRQGTVKAAVRPGDLACTRPCVGEGKVPKHAYEHDWYKLYTL